MQILCRPLPAGKPWVIKVLTTKTVLLMNLIGIFLLAGVLQVSAAVTGQTVTYSGKSVPVSTILSFIEKQTGFVFFYDKEDVNENKLVTVKFKNEQLSSALKKILEGEKVEFDIQGNTVFITKSSAIDNVKPQLSSSLTVPPVTGIVRGPDGQPIAGANVVIKGTKRGTTTNVDGSFNIQVNKDDILIISSIGYSDRQIPLIDNTLENIILVRSDSKLDEVQIIAYGTTSKKFSTTNVGTVSAKEIANQPVSNPLLALQGRVPGLFIEQTSGVTAGPVNVTIQGNNSLQSGNAPFYVIDGIPYSPEFGNYSLLGGAIAGGNGSTFNFINPADVESVSVLKDADATAIYGSRAANGAILITTKKGKAGKTRFDINFKNGWGRINHKLQYLNTEQYLEIRKEAYVNGGQQIPNSTNIPTISNYDLTVWDQNRYTDWQEELVGGIAHFTDVQASISGGNSNTQFLVSYGYNRQTTVFPGDFADKKGNIHLNINHNSADNKFKYILNATYLQDKNTLAGSDLMDQAVSLSPNAPALYNSDGTLNWEPYPNNPTLYSFSNPLAYTMLRYAGNTSNLTANNTLSYEIIKGLSVKANIGYSKLQADESRITPLTFFKPDEPRKIRSASLLTKSITSWIIEPQITYSKNIGSGVLDILLGSSFQQTINDAYQQTGSGFTSDAQLENLLVAPTKSIDVVFKSLYRYDAVFARVNYRLQDKYIINLTGRKDGSSRFGEQNKFHTFYAAGGAWLFGEENIIKKHVPFLSAGKIRINYGTTGNDQIGDYSYLSLLETYGVTLPYQGGISLYNLGLSNPLLQWEETRKFNIGAELGFLKNRIDVDINYFRNRSSNQLISNLLPTTVGFSGITQNFPATVQNTGFEILLNLKIIRSKNFAWQSSFNLTTPRNKVVAFPGLENSTYADFYILGQPTNIVRAYKFSGVNTSTGLYEFINDKGEKTSSPSRLTDRTQMIDINPKWYGGISNSIEFKGFQLDFLITIVNQMAQNYRFGNFPGTSPQNQPIIVLDRWKSSGDIASLQKFSTAFGTIVLPGLAVSASDANYSGASYARLKNASLSYNLPQDLLRQVHISSARIYLQGQNLFTITNFIGSDPETKSLRNLPPLRMFTIGGQITF
jgi:TonB-dependent starch-binding outer membrane protein SusC